MARPTCFAFDTDTKLRCSRPGGHAGNHRVVKEFDDDTAWVPILSGDDLAEQIRTRVVTPLRPGDGPLVIPEVEPDPPVAEGTCVVCNHADPHPTPDEVGDNAGCTHPGCQCLTAVWV